MKRLRANKNILPSLFMFIILINLLMISSCSEEDGYVNNSNNTNRQNAEDKQNTTEINEQDTFVHDFKPGEENIIGNTSANIGNRGYVAFQGDWVYYSCNDSSQLMKMKKDGSNRTVLFQRQGMLDFHYIQVVGDWIYFTAVLGDEHHTNGYEFYKMKTDGSETILLLEKEYSNDMKPFVVGNYIYYVSGENIDQKTVIRSIVCMNADGEEKTVLFAAKDYFNSKTNGIHILSADEKNIYFMEGIIAVWHLNLADNNVKQLTPYQKNSNGNIKGVYYDYILIGNRLFYANDDTFYHLNSELNYLDIDSLKTTLVFKTQNIKICNNIGDNYIGRSENRILAYFPKELKTSREINTDSTYQIFTYTDNEWIYYTSSDHLYRVKPDGTSWEKLL